MKTRPVPSVLATLAGVVLVALALTAAVALAGRGKDSTDDLAVPTAEVTVAQVYVPDASPSPRPRPATPSPTGAVTAPTSAPPSPSSMATPTPTLSPAPTPSGPSPSPSPLPAVFLEVPAYGQERTLSCEAAAMRMLLGYYGLNLSEDEIQAAFPITVNPEIGFRGNVDGYTGFTDYGAHAPAVAAALQSLLERAGRPYEAVWQTFPSRDEAMAAVHALLSDDTPVIVWMTWYARFGQVPATQVIHVPDPVTLVYGEHVEVAYGLEGRVMYVLDPYSYTKQDGRTVRTRPHGFRYTWKNGPPGWEYFGYAIVYLQERPPYVPPVLSLGMPDSMFGHAGRPETLRAWGSGPAAQVSAGFTPGGLQ